MSLDARDGKIATDGWEKTSRIDVIEIAEKFAQLDPAAFLYTDISRDGVMRARGNRKGVFTRERQPKTAAFFLKDRWANKNEK